jgi:fructose-1,6-bisphosphatase/inositol monophosphatase family enzyme
VITDWEGKELKMESNIRLIASANIKLHNEILEIINFTDK